MNKYSNSDVSVVVCTMNSISGIQECLASLREVGVGEIIVVDANSTDGTQEIASKLADKLLVDPGTGLGNARNIGIKESTGNLILNMGSDNVMPEHQLEKMIHYLEQGGFHGVAAKTQVIGESFCAQGLNSWRAGRFPEGERAIIGTPTLFLGDTLREHPYDPSRRFSDDSELCERWTKKFNAKFAISDAVVLEVGKTSWNEVQIRAKMYGISDQEVFMKNRGTWSLARKTKSLLHPLTADFITPVQQLSLSQAPRSILFLAAFTSLRYASWLTTEIRLRQKNSSVDKSN